MLCPHCGKEIEQQPTMLSNLNAAGGCNPAQINHLTFTVKASENPFPVLNLQANACAAGANPIVTFIKS